MDALISTVAPATVCTSVESWSDEVAARSTSVDACEATSAMLWLVPLRPGRRLGQPPGAAVDGLDGVAGAGDGGVDRAGHAGDLVGAHHGRLGGDVAGRQPVERGGRSSAAGG